MDYGFIYILENSLNGKCYIGQTIDLKRRFKQHRTKKYSVISKAIKKYGWENFIKEYIKVPRHMLSAYEVMMIRTMNTFLGSGYNLTEGGETGPSYNPSIYKNLVIGDITILRAYKRNKKSKCLCLCGLCSSKFETGTINITRGNTKSCGCLHKSKIRNLKKSYIGKKYNFLTIMSLFYKNGYGRLKTICLCDCGKKIETYYTRVRGGGIKSCGCFRSTRVYNKLCGMIGKKYGYLKIINVVRLTKGWAFACMCDCGEYKNIPYTKIEITKSCGCFGENERKIKNDELIGKRFGKLEILSIYYERDKKYRGALAECLCECGTIKKTRLSGLKNSRVISCGCSRRKPLIKRIKNKNREI